MNKLANKRKEQGHRNVVNFPTNEHAIRMRLSFWGLLTQEHRAIATLKLGRELAKYNLHLGNLLAMLGINPKIGIEIGRDFLDEGDVKKLIIYISKFYPHAQEFVRWVTSGKLAEISGF